MPDTAWREEVGRRVVTQQIIVGGLVVGCIAFLAVAAVLVHRGIVEPNAELTQIMHLVLVLFLASVVAARLIVPGAIVARGRRKIAAGQWSPPQGSAQGDLAAFVERTGDAGRLLMVYQMRTIVAAAPLEGVAFFATIVFMLTQSIVALAVAVALIVALAFHVPSRSGVVHWVEEQLQQIERERHFGPNG
jgi:hypothetical protein